MQPSSAGSRGKLGHQHDSDTVGQGRWSSGGCGGRQKLRTLCSKTDGRLAHTSPGSRRLLKSSLSVDTSEGIKGHSAPVSPTRISEESTTMRAPRRDAKISGRHPRVIPDLETKTPKSHCTRNKQWSFHQNCAELNSGAQWLPEVATGVPLPSTRRLTSQGWFF